MGIRLSSRAVVIHDKKILLNQMGDGIYFIFPGGQIEDTETAPEAVVREVLEETGYDIEVEEYIFTFEYEANHCNHYEGGGHRISIFFKCKLKNEKQKETPTYPDVDPNDSTLKSKPKWISISELNAIPFVPSAIKESLIKYITTGIFEPKYFECTAPKA
jgi:8-oxo-dGTP diphosphatase